MPRGVYKRKHETVKEVQGVEAEEIVRLSTVYITVETLEELKSLHRLLSEVDMDRLQAINAEDGTITVEAQFDHFEMRLLHVSGLGYSG